MIFDKDKFIKNTKDSRNYYTHYDSDLEEKALKGTNVVKQPQILKVILIGTVLFETGFTIEEINQLFKRNDMMFWNHLIKEEEATA